MSARRGLLSMVTIGLAAAVAWTSLGTLDSASGQEEPILIDRAHAGARRPSFEDPIFLLVLGGDARAGNPERVRMDSIHIVSMVPGRNRASIVGIPRDSYVQSSQGFGRRKITDLGFLEGVDGFIQTVEDLSGCTFDYYMLTSFDGFRGPVREENGRRQKQGPGLIDDLGGVTVTVPFALPDPAPVPLKAGTYRMNGNQAMSFARNRHDRPRGDFDRSLAQGTFMKAVLTEMRGDFAEDPGTALRNLAAVRRHVQLNIPIGEAYRLGLMALEIRPKRVKNIVLDGAIGSAGGASIVNITQRGRAQLVDVCTDGLLDSN